MIDHLHRVSNQPQSDSELVAVMSLTCGLDSVGSSVLSCGTASEPTDGSVAVGISVGLELPSASETIAVATVESRCASATTGTSISTP